MINTRYVGKSLRGFTIVELLICIVIMMLMTGVLMGSYPESTMKLTLANANSTLALLVREAQLRGSSVDSINNNIGGYGIFFDRATSTDVVLFADHVDTSLLGSQVFGVGDGLYESGPTDEKKSVTKLQARYSYKKLCVATTTPPASVTGFVCNDNYPTAINTLTISFSRPSQVAHIYINNSTSTEFTAACIQTYSPNTPEVGHIFSVKVYHSGMILTERKSCD